jgi:peptide/nickel transport system ATP-binding protein
VVETGNCEQIFNQPRHPYTRGLLRCIPVPGRTAPGGHLGIIPGTVPALTGALQGCMFRDRCDHALPICSAAPPVRSDTDGHDWRCILDKTGRAA